MLSDSCFEFLERIRMAVATFGQDVESWQSDDVMHYCPAEMTEALADACRRAILQPYDGDSLSKLVRLASDTMHEIDALLISFTVLRTVENKQRKNWNRR